MDIDVLVGIPGSGKTSKYIEAIPTTPSKYLIAMPRRDFIDESSNKLRDLLNELPPQNPVIIDSIYSQDYAPSSRIPVSKQIQQAPERYKDQDHVCIFCTHTGLMDSDLSGYNGWNVFIDEVPNAVSSGIMDVPLTAQYLQTVTTLNPSPHSEWSLAFPNSNTPDLKTVSKDVCLKELSLFFKYLHSPNGIYLNVKDWNEFMASGKPLKWYYEWDLQNLSAFKSKTFAGSGFFDSIFHKVIANKTSSSFNFKKIDVSNPRTKLPRVQIKYFTRGHRGSTHFWGKDDGMKCLNLIADYLNAHYSKDQFYWSGNDNVRKHLANYLKGFHVPPKQEGSNALVDYRMAVMIYSAKALDTDTPLMQINGITKQEILRAREIEDLIQFFTRGIIRNPNFTETYVFYVYDEYQANMLAEYIIQKQIATVETIPVHEAGIMDFKRPTVSRVRDNQITLSSEEKAAKRREADKLRKRKTRNQLSEIKKMNGSYVPPGRPTKAAKAKRDKSAILEMLESLKNDRNTQPTL